MAISSKKKKKNQGKSPREVLKKAGIYLSAYYEARKKLGFKIIPRNKIASPKMKTIEIPPVTGQLDLVLAYQIVLLDCFERLRK